VIGCGIDFETTGLLKEGSADFIIQPGIVQIGAVRTDGREFSTLINPELSRDWEAGAMKVHGITPDDVKNAPTFFAIFPKFAEFVTGCDTWFGYNTKFDKDVLWHQLFRYGFERSFPWPVNDLDVMKLASNHMAMQGKRGTKRPKLVEIYEHLFKQPFEAHDALKDIRATHRVLKELTK
jgi:DNA polymerase III epsilon subunit-like protein